MEPLPIGKIVEVTGGSWIARSAAAAGPPPGGDPPRDLVAEVSTDSRTVGDRALFFALSGDRFDGHAFVSEARRRGALASIVRRTRSGDLPPEGGPYIGVEDPLDALERLATWNRDRLPIRVVAITGSVGKTTTKEFLATLLGARFRVKSAPKSFNNRIGVATTLISAAPDTEILVSELGASGPGEISHLARLVRPHVAVVTEIAPAHLEGFVDLDGVVRAKAEIFEGLEPGGTAVIRDGVHGFDRLRAAAGDRVRTFGWGTGDWKVTDCRRSGDGHSFAIDGPGGDRRELRLPAPGRHNVLNALAAIAVARELGMSWDSIGDALARCRLPPLRLQTYRAGGIEILDDSYNANPASMRAALEEWLAPAAEDPGAPRGFVAVLGEMLELGVASRRLHEELGARLAGSPLRLLVSVGPGARWIGESFRSGGGRGEVRHLDSSSGLADLLRGALREGDRVLFKGSRRVALDAVVTELRAALEGRPTAG